MQLEQHFLVAVPLARVWEAFHDPELLVSCLPGASLRGPAEASTLPLLFKVKLGPIAAAFAGSGELTLDEAAHCGALSGQAADGKSNSRVKGDAAFDLTEAEGGTRVGVNVTFSITGSLAQFSREGIVRALADQLTRQFAENLQGVLMQDAIGEDEGVDASSATHPAHANPAHQNPAHAHEPASPPTMRAAAADDAAIAGAGGIAIADTGSASSGPVHAPAVAPPSAAATAAAANASATASAYRAAASPSCAAALPSTTAPASSPPQTAPRRPLPRPAAEVPALNLFSLIGAVIRDYWRKFFKRKPS